MYVWGAILTEENPVKVIVFQKFETEKSEVEEVKSLCSIRHCISFVVRSFSFSVLRRYPRVNSKVLVE